MGDKISTENSALRGRESGCGFAAGLKRVHGYSFV